MGPFIRSVYEQFIPSVPELTIFLMHLLDSMSIPSNQNHIVVKLGQIRCSGEFGTRHPTQRVQRGDVIQGLQNLECKPRKDSNSCPISSRQRRNGTLNSVCHSFSSLNNKAQ